MRASPYDFLPLEVGYLRFSNVPRGVRVFLLHRLYSCVIVLRVIGVRAESRFRAIPLRSRRLLVRIQSGIIINLFAEALYAPLPEARNAAFSLSSRGTLPCIKEDSMFRAMYFPSYPKKKHKASGQARIRWRGKDYYLGRFDSPESRVEYARLAALFATAPEAAPVKRPESLTVAGMIHAWHADAEKWSAPKELAELERAALVLERLYGPTPAAKFGVAELGVVREAMIKGSWLTEAERADYRKRKLPLSWAKSTVNHQMGRVKRIFRFAEQMGLVAKGTWEHLRSLRPLRKNEVRETPKRKPVDEAIVEKTLPHLSLMVASMVRVQLLTGMRPSELCGMTCDKFQPGPDGTLLYRLDEYKSAHLPDAQDWQMVVLGPSAQAAILPFLEAARALGGSVFLWRPRPNKQACYTESGYYQAVVDGCKRAKVPPFHVYQLRHAACQRITRLMGSDAARAVLRQRTLDATQHYSNHQDLELAAKIAKMAG